jgi:hypothetical protein
MVFSCRDAASLKRYVPKSKARRLAPPGLIGFARKAAYSAACSSFSRTRGGDIGSA